MTFSQLLDLGAKKLSNLDLPRLEAMILLSYQTKCSKEKIFANLKEEVNLQDEDSFLGLINKRLDGMPSAYIVGTKEFYGRDFYVSPDVLIPRPDTEILVETVIEIVKSGKWYPQFDNGHCMFCGLCVDFC